MIKKAGITAISAKQRIGTFAAKELVYAYASVIKLVRKYLADFQEFGRGGFEIHPFDTAGGVQQHEVADLNQEQSALLMTYIRNIEAMQRLMRETMFHKMVRKEIRTETATSECRRCDVIK